MARDLRTQRERGQRSRARASTLPPRAGCPIGQAVHARLEEAGELVEVAAALDEANLRAQRVRIDEVRERDIREIELTGDTDHARVQVLLDERAICADAELASEHDIECVR